MLMATTTVYGSPHPRVRVLVADDHEVMRLGIRNLLEIQPGWSVCAEANNGQEALEKTLQFRPDVIIMDISMPVMNGLEAASLITKEQPQFPVILFSLHLSRRPLSSFQDGWNSRERLQRGCGARSGPRSADRPGGWNILSGPEIRSELTVG